MANHCSLLRLALLLLLSGIAVVPTSQAAILVWEFDIDEQQVRNGPEADGSTNSPATGSGLVSYDTATNVFSYSITWDNLASNLTKLHIHGPATESMSNPQHLYEVFGPPEIPAAVNLISDIWTDSVELMTLSQPGFDDLSPAEVIDVMSDGLAYVNVHTEFFGMGEIRGNLGLPTVVPEPAGVPVAMLIAGATAICRLRRRRC